MIRKGGRNKSFLKQWREGVGVDRYANDAKHGGVQRQTDHQKIGTRQPNQSALHSNSIETCEGGEEFSDVSLLEEAGM